MGNSEIKQHHLLAQGKDIDVGDGCETCFKGVNVHGGEEISKKKHNKDGSRSMSPKQKHADHGPHEMHPLDYHD